MSLSAMLAAHDEGALTALASAGALRRAARDHEAGKARVLDRTADSASVDAAGQTVAINGEGPRAASCPCPATGVCRHILLAVLALQADPARPDTADTPAPAPAIDVKEELLAIDDAQLHKFAGADLAAATALARDSENQGISRDGQALQVALTGAPHPVTFIPSAGLAGAAYKGPRTRKRMMIAAAALLVRKANDLPLSMPAPAAPADQLPLTDAHLSEVAQTLVSASRQALTGTADIAQEHLFDLAISSRAAAAPRLAGGLRELSVLAGRAAAHHVSFVETDFLSMVGDTLALVQGLRARPDDPALTGTLRRSFHPTDPQGLWIAGVHPWRTPSGARGLRVYGIDPDRGTWHSGGPARGAGMDPGFSLEVAYHTALWGAGAIRELGGKLLDLTAPMTASDGALSDLSRAAIAPAQTSVLDKLRAAGAIHDTWADLRVDLARRFGQGLRAQVGALPVLLCPSAKLRPAFDDLTQTYAFALTDRAGDHLTLGIPAENHDRTLYLHDTLTTANLLLCEARISGGSLSLLPVSVIRDSLTGPGVTNLGLDPLPAKTLRLTEILRRFSGIGSGRQTARTRPDPHLRLAEDALEAAVEALAYRDRAPALKVADRAGALGLARLTAAAACAGKDGSDEAVIRLAYLGAALRRVAALDPPA